LLHRHGREGITIQYSRLPFSCYDGSRPRKADIPALTGIQKEALNALQTISAKHAFPVPTKPGDILYFNNIGLFHGREEYVDRGTKDTPAEDMDRHVLRLWLQDPKRTEPVAPPLQKIWDEIYGPNTANGRVETWNVKAVAAFAMNACKNG
jgi:Taurine catabolism dioxygenase TauD, TfdA family